MRTASVSCGQLEGTRMPADASSAASYATATDNLRTATRWLLTAAAAAGAVFVAGLQLTSIGSPRYW